MQIKTLGDGGGEHQRWDEFVQDCTEATFFHRSGWREVIERSFGHRTYFLYAQSEGELQGVLPLGHINSRIFGNSLISLPFCVCSGVAARSDEARAALTEAAAALARRLRVDHLELRHRHRYLPDWPAKDDLYVSFRKTLQPDPQANLMAIPRKQRAMVRKGIEAGLQSVVDEDIDRFYAAYSESVRNLGTPVFGRRYFHNLKQVFGDDCGLLTVIDRDGELVASVMSFYFRDEVLPYYGGGVVRARQLKGNDFMYWELMRRVCERGVRVFDYGRSKVGTGSYSFKKNWGFTPQPLYYEYLLVKASELPDVNPLNPKYRLFIHLWQRLPLSFSRHLGPFLARNLG